MIIEGNIKQANRLVKTTTSVNREKGSYFTFSDSAADAWIHFCPEYQLNPVVVEDIGLLSSSAKTDNIISEYVNSIPRISIREFQPDIPQDQWISIFQKTYESFKQFFEKNDKVMSTLMDKIRSTVTAPNFVETICKDIKGIFQDGDMNMYNFPEILYRRLLSYTDLNRYELPYSGKIFMKSNGQEGWEINDLRKRSQLLSGLKNVNISTKPTWKLDNLGGDTIQFELDLFNDTIEAAQDNFKFVHTIIPNNMWTQWGLFQHSPSLYDVQFDGGLRFFCCSLNINCENEGNSRIPRKKFFENILNSENVYMKSFAKELENGSDSFLRLMRIPDIWKISFDFKSLLPNNFNQYLMTFAEQDRIWDGRMNGVEDGHFTTVYGDIGKKIADVIDGIVKNTYNESTQTSKESTQTSKTKVTQAQFDAQRNYLEGQGSHIPSDQEVLQSLADERRVSSEDIEIE